MFLCILIVMYVPFCVFWFIVVLCMVCISMCTVLLPRGVNPIAVNKYVISYHHINKCCKIHAHVYAFENVGTAAIQGQWHYSLQISHHNIAVLSCVFILTLLLSVVFCLVTAMHKFDTRLVIKQTVKKWKLWKVIRDIPYLLA